MKKYICFAVILLSVLNFFLFVPAYSNAQELMKTNEVIEKNEPTYKIVYLNSENIPDIGTCKHEFEGGGGGGGAILYVTVEGITRAFNVSKHAIERVMDRFNGNWATVERILTKGDIYDDVAHEGYAAYNSSRAVVLSKDLNTIVTVMDDVSIWEKIANGIWKILSEAIKLF